MDIVMLNGTIVSEEIKVLKTDNGIPLCYFAVESNQCNYNCLISGKLAYSFLFEAEKATKITFSAKVNDRSQLIVLRYSILENPSYFGKIFDYKGHRLPSAKR